MPRKRGHTESEKHDVRIGDELRDELGTDHVYSNDEAGREPTDSL